MQSTLQTLAITVATIFCLSVIYSLFTYFHKHGRAVIAAIKLTSVNPPLPITIYILVVFGIVDFLNVILTRAKRLISDGIQGCVFWTGTYPIFVVYKPDDIQVVVNNTLEVGAEADVFKEFIGNGLLTCPVDIWRTTRRSLQAFYHPRNLEFLVPSLNQSGRDLAHRLSRHVGSGLFDIEEDLAETALQSACNLIFGPWVNVNIKTSTSKDILKSLNRLGDLIGIRSTRFWLWSDFIFRILYKKEIQKIHSSFHNYIKEITKLNEDQGLNFEQIPRSDNNGDNRSLVTKQDEEYMTLIDNFRLLINNNPNFTDTDLRNEVASTLAAVCFWFGQGSETSQMAVSSCLLALAAHPEIQERLYSEIVSVVGSEDRDVTVEDLKCMPYLEQVLKETLRIFPIVPMITRKTQRDLKLSYGTVPAGSTLGVMLFGVHWDPNHYPNPEKYDPDRFHSENVAKRNKYAYVPFLAGPRNCIGKGFAMMSMKIVVAHLIKKYRFTTNVDLEKLSYLPALVFRSQNGYKVEIFSRCNVHQ